MSLKNESMESMESMVWLLLTCSEARRCLQRPSRLYALLPPVFSIPDHYLWWDVPSAQVVHMQVHTQTHQKGFCTGTQWKSMTILFYFFTLFLFPLQMTEFRGFQIKKPCWHEWLNKVGSCWLKEYMSQSSVPAPMQESRRPEISDEFLPWLSHLCLQWELLCN